MSLISTNWGGNWIEPTINLPHFADLSASELLGPLLDDKPLPSRILLPVVHETTHHLCFHRAVGTALAALKLTVSRLLKSRNASHILLARKYYKKLLISRAALTPLVEGLALYAEYDVLPFNELATFDGLKVLFCNKRTLSDEKERKVLNHVVALLKEARTQSETQDKYCSILCDPLTGGQHYLLGYMLIQTLGLKIYSDSQRLMEKNISDKEFLKSFYLLQHPSPHFYIVSYFFDDYAFASLLLDEPRDDDPERIVGYIRKRIAYLLRNNTGEVFAKIRKFHAFQTNAINTGFLTQGRSFPIYTEDRDDQVDGFKKYSDVLMGFGVTVLDQYFQYLDEKYDAGGDRLLLSPIPSLALSWRTNILLGDVEVDFEIQKTIPNDVIIKQGGRIYGTMPLTRPNLRGWTSNGTLSVYYSMAHSCLTFVLKSGGFIVSDYSIGDPPELYKETLRYSAYSKRQLIRIAKDEEEEHTGLLENDSSTISEMQSVINYTRSLLESYFIPIALLDFPQSSLPQIKPLLMDNGYLRLFKKTADLRTYALFRTTVANQLSVEETFKLFKKYDLDYSVAFDKASEARVVSGSPKMIKY